MYSIVPNIREKKKNELKFFFGFKIINKKETKPQNNAKKAGIKTTVKGIKNLKLSSKVKDIEIQ